MSEYIFHIAIEPNVKYFFVSWSYYISLKQWENKIKIPNMICENYKTID